MPDERVAHPREGHSRKLSALSDFEYRVWSQYRLTANDVGVMRDSPTPLMADNAVLEQRGSAKVRVALGRLVDVGLLRRFEHQGESFVYSTDWQDYQGVKYPRETPLPVPSGDLFLACSGLTQQLFVRLRKWTAERQAKRSQLLDESQPTVGQPLENDEPINGQPFTEREKTVGQPLVSESPIVARVPARGEARNANANANRVGSLEGVQGEPAAESEKPAVHQCFERFAACFDERVGQRPEFSGGKDAKLFEDLIGRHGLEQVLATIEQLFASKDPWIRQSGYTVGVLKSQWNKLTTERLASRPKATQTWKERCKARGHEPLCGTPTACELRHGSTVSA